METKAYIQRQIGDMCLLRDAVMKDTTDEQFNWTPPGEANSIRAALVHLIVAEDRYIQAAVQGKPTLWEAGQWGDKIGLSAPPTSGKGWDEIKAATLPLAPVRDYANAVRTATDAYIASLTPEELGRTVPFMGGQRTVAEVLARLIVHTSGHVGEIAALKGIQGVKGLPF